MRQHVPPEQLWNEFHGDLEFEYDHSVYWPAFLQLCEEHHSAQVKRWTKAGKHYGESEIYLKGGNAPSIYQSIVQEPVKEVEKRKEDSLLPVEKGQGAEPSKAAPVRTHGSHKNGNTELMAVTPAPGITIEGDRP